MPPDLLLVENLTLATANGYIVRDLTFSIGKGEIVALTGRSGSGKTSIALAILGMRSPGVQWAGGHIHFIDRSGRQHSYPDREDTWPDLRGRHIGFIQQDVFGAFDPVIRIGKQIVMIIKERNSTKNDPETEIRNLLDEVGIDDVERIWNSFPHQLSGGQLQRCLLCMAIALEPALLIADEPTSAIDQENQLEILSLLSGIREKYGISILCVSHEKNVIENLADRVISLDVYPNTIYQHSKEKSSYSNKALLQADRLSYTHRFGGIFQKRGAGVSNFSLKAEGGKCIGIIGKSGSGKSTIAQILVGILKPASGKLIVDGKEIDFHDRNSIRFLRSKVQLVMQDGRGSLHPGKTIRSILEEIIHYQKEAPQRSLKGVSEVLHEVKLPEQILERKAAGLSGGECLRVSIARALLVVPEVLICDESTSALDSGTRDEILALFRDLMRERQLALILISHDDSLIRELADEVILISHGAIMGFGSIHEMFPHLPGKSIS